jgi:hypothetical protein
MLKIRHLKKIDFYKKIKKSKKKVDAQGFNRKVNDFSLYR